MMSLNPDYYLKAHYEVGLSSDGEIDRMDEVRDAVLRIGGESLTVSKTVCYGGETESSFFRIADLDENSRTSLSERVKGAMTMLPYPVVTEIIDKWRMREIDNR